MQLPKAMRPFFVALVACASVATGADGHGFSFRAIEFAPADQREPAANRFLARRAAPGTPLPVAIAAIRHAEASCRNRAEPDGAIICRYSRPISDSASDMPLGDVTWTVRLYPTANGTVARSTVKRERVGQ